MGDNIIRIDSVLARIAEGNNYETTKDFWQAAYCFGDAMGLLFQLAIEMTPQNEEDERILELYQAQCREYLHRGREMLIQALSEEDANDTSDNDGDPKFITLADDEARKRVQLFSTLFSKELELGVEELDLPDVAQLSEQQSSIEARLKQLNSSLIPSMKTEAERIRDINQGLKGLGVNVHSYADQPRPTIEVPLSTEDQVASIIAQASDEVRLGDLHGSRDVDNDIVLTDDDDDITDDEEVDVGADELIPKLLNKRGIRKCVVNAQAKLAQLLVLLDSEPTAVSASSPTEASHNVDSDEDDADERRDTLAERVELDLDLARTLLIKAEKNLAKAAAVWVVE